MYPFKISKLLYSSHLGKDYPKVLVWKTYIVARCVRSVLAETHKTTERSEDIEKVFEKLKR